MGDKPSFNFRSKRPVPTSVQPPAPTKAEALGLKPPKLTAEQAAGSRAENALAGQALAAKIEAWERFKTEKAAAERARDDAIWERVLARQKAAV
jgi:hypothetical protein